MLATLHLLLRSLLLPSVSCAGLERLTLSGLHPGLPCLQFPFEFDNREAQIVVRGWAFIGVDLPLSLMTVLLVGGPVLVRSGNTPVSTFIQAEWDRALQPVSPVAFPSLGAP